MPDEVIGFLNLANPSSHYGPGVDSASRSSEYQESSGGQPTHKADKLTTIYEPIV
jgi:hypothetical protein